MSFSGQIKKITRFLAIFMFTLLELLGLPRISDRKAERGKDQK